MVRFRGPLAARFCVPAVNRRHPPAFAPPMLLPTFLLAALAQGDDPASSEDLSETVVTAPRSELPATASATNVVVVTGEQLAATGESTLPRALSRAAGPVGLFVQETNLGGGSPYLRGLIGNQILIVVDGVRLNDSTTRFGPNQSLNNIDPATVERVEILRGPASVLYGSDAIGGTILIWTKRRRASSDPSLQGVRGSLDLLYRSQVEGGSASVGLNDATPSYGWYLSTGVFDYQDLRGGDGRTQDFTGYDGNNFFGSVDVPLDKERSVRVVSSLHRDFDVPRTDRLVAGFGQTGPADQVNRFTLQRRERHVLAYEDRSGLGALADRFQVRASFRRYEERRERQGTGSSTFRDEEDAVDTYGVGVDFKKAIGSDHLLTYGLDFDLDRVDSSRVDTNLGTGVETVRDGAFAPGSNYAASGVFVQDEIFAFDPLLLTAGLRWSTYDFSFDRFSDGERESGNFSALTASLQASRAVAEGVRVVGSLAQGFRAPNLADLAKDGDFAAGTELSNPDLDPERSLSAELGVEVLRGVNEGHVTVFATQIDDIVGRVLVDSGDPGTLGDEIYRRENQGEVRLWGIEAGLRRRLDADSPWLAETGIAYARGQQFDDEIPEFDDVPWRRTPPLHGRVAVAWEPIRAASSLPDKGRVDRVALELPWADDQSRLSPDDETDPRIGAPTPGWAVLNLDVSGSFGRANRWTVGLQNLLDKDYRLHGSGFDAPGRGVYVGLRFAF